MNRSVLPIAVALLTGMLSCDNEPQDPGAEFLKFEVYEVAGSPNVWVFANNEKGEILDVVQYRSGVSFSLRTKSDFSSIDLTFFSIHERTTGEKSFSLVTYKNIPAGETWQIGDKIVDTAPNPSVPYAGAATITMNNYTESLNPDFNLNFTQAPYGPRQTQVSFVDGVYKAGIALVKSPTKMVVFGSRNKMPAYHVLPNFQAGDNVVVDFQNFQSYENLIELKGANGFTYVAGMQETDFNTLQTILVTENVPGSDALYLGTIPGFSTYTMRVHSYLDGLDYYRVGAPITSFSFPQYTTSITDKSFGNFTIEMDAPYDYKTIGWSGVSGTDNVFWTVTADNAHSVALNFNIPGQIINLCPALRTKEFKDQPVIFYASNGTFTYTDLLNSVFRKERKILYEQFTLPAK